MSCRNFCPEECILYAGDILVREGQTIIASGTVFRSILIWDADDCQMLHRLQGHTGVIFDVRFLQSNEQQIAPLELVSVSDDRSIRVWK